MTTHPGIQKISIEGYRSIRKLTELELGSVNVLIGANGAGKSNFLTFFELLRAVASRNLQMFVGKAGKASRQLHLGPKVSSQLNGRVTIGDEYYSFDLHFAEDDSFVFGDEGYHSAAVTGAEGPGGQLIGLGRPESQLWIAASFDHPSTIAPRRVHDALARHVVYHFRDTSAESRARLGDRVSDTDRFREDGSNLAPFLFYLQSTAPTAYRRIRDTVRRVAPFFDDFRFKPTKDRYGDEQVILEWQQRGSDYPFHPSHLSDGTLRFIALATALLQPEPPPTVLIDEPELGLHPYALELLAGLIQISDSQVIIATHSATLVNCFDPEQIIVVDRGSPDDPSDYGSHFRRLGRDELTNWLKDYTLGELWEKNVFGGTPTNA